MSADSEYDALIRKVLEDGSVETGRNGEVQVLIGASMRLSLRDGVVPFVTKKTLAWKTCLRELLWFISGGTDSVTLSATGCRIWDANGSREFLDSRGLVDIRVVDLGPVYGHQWRYYGAPYSNADEDYDSKGVDQLANVISALQDVDKRTSRRIVMCAWNPSQIDEMALPPCHVLVQFNVTDGNKLHCSVYQRSGDVGLGVPFNIASYGMLTHLLAAHCGLEAVELYHTIGNAHIYRSHAPVLKEYLERRSATAWQPTLEIKEIKSDIRAYTESDFRVNGYTGGGKCPLPFVA
jgi:thymidylate synthase